MRNFTIKKIILGFIFAVLTFAAQATEKGDSSFQNKPFSVACAANVSTANIKPRMILLIVKLCMMPSNLFPFKKTKQNAI